MKRHLGVLFAAALTALASFALLASAAQATTPAPPYEDFAGCPNEAEQPFVAKCLKLEFDGGHIGIGKRDIPITNTILFRGATEQETAQLLFNSEGGIIPVRQTVPGGLIGLTGYSWLDELVESSSLLKLYATVELAGQPGVFRAADTTVPIKVHLENPLLGSSCYVGSNANPITLHLTTRTTNPPPPNEPISGYPVGQLEEEEGREAFYSLTSGLYVDNSYSVPAASGCQFNLGPIHKSIDSLVNSQYGLPAAAGTNETALEFDITTAFPHTVYPS